VAQVDYFLKIDGVDGESKDAKHKNEIDIESWSWGAVQSGTPQSGGGGGGAGKVSMQDFHFVMRLTKASPKLMLACANGKHIKMATLTARKAGKTQQEYLTFKFSDVLVSSYQTGGAEGGDDTPIEQVSLNFSKVEMSYREQKPDGTLGTETKVGWDLKANKRL
jgi:type VI secretion system secreted protein Hcp